MCDAALQLCQPVSSVDVVQMRQESGPLRRCSGPGQEGREQAPRHPPHPTQPLLPAAEARLVRVSFRNLLMGGGGGGGQNERKGVVGSQIGCVVNGRG